MLFFRVNVHTTINLDHIVAIQWNLEPSDPINATLSMVNGDKIELDVPTSSALQIAIQRLPIPSGWKDSWPDAKGAKRR